MKRRPKRSQLAQSLPLTLDDLAGAGGPETLARNAAANAAAIAVRQEREFWLHLLEGLVLNDLDFQDQVTCSMWISDLRRKLGLGQRKEVVREQTRERVRRFRERRAAGDRPSPSH